MNDKQNNEKILLWGPHSKVNGADNQMQTHQGTLWDLLAQEESGCSEDHL